MTETLMKNSDLIANILHIYTQTPQVMKEAQKKTYLPEFTSTCAEVGS